MTDPKSLTLDDLTNLFDDVEPAEHDESPANSSMPTLAPPPPGKYGTRLFAIDVDRDSTGSIRNKKQFVCTFEVVEAPTTGQFMVGKRINFIRVNGESKKRKGKDGVERPYVELFDLVHGFDAGFNCQNSLDTAMRFLLERIAERDIVYWQLDWKGWDTKHFQSCNGDMLQNGSTEKIALYKEVSIRGARFFGNDGTMINPKSGNNVKANPYLRFVYTAQRTDLANAA